MEVITSKGVCIWLNKHICDLFLLPITLPLPWMSEVFSRVRGYKTRKASSTQATIPFVEAQRNRFPRKLLHSRTSLSKFPQTTFETAKEKAQRETRDRTRGEKKKTKIERR